MIVLGIETTTTIGSVAIVKDGSVKYVALPGEMNHAEKIIPAIAKILKLCNLEMQDIHRVAVSVGPGSFTGIRIGITVARTLAQVSGKTAVAVPTLDSIAYACADSGEIICPIIKAIGGEVYYAFYRKTSVFERISSYEVSDIKTLCAYAVRLRKKVLFVGEGLLSYEQPIKNLMKRRCQYLDSNEKDKSPLTQKSPLVPLCQRGRRGTDEESPLPPPLQKGGRGDFAAKEFWQPNAKSIALMGAFLPGCEWSQLSALYIRPSEAERKWKKKKYLLRP